MDYTKMMSEKKFYTPCSKEIIKKRIPKHLQSSLIPRSVVNKGVLKRGIKPSMGKKEVSYSIPELPDEIWLYIFQLVLQSGQYPAMHRLPLVCRRWHRLSWDDSLWRRVDLTCSINRWVTGGEESLKWLALHHGHSLQEVKLGNWHFLTSRAVTHLAMHSPNLRVVDVSYCGMVRGEAIKSLTKYCKKLQHVNISGTPKSTVHIDSVNLLTKMTGKQLTTLLMNSCIHHDFNLKMNSISENCPNLEQLEITGIEKEVVSLDVEKWQHGLPKLRVLQLGFIDLENMEVPCEPDEKGQGWPMLQKLSLCINSYEDWFQPFLMDISLLKRFLWSSSNLQELELTNDTEVPAGDLLLLDLPNLHRIAMADRFWEDEAGLEKFVAKYSAQLERVWFAGPYQYTDSVVHSAMQSLIKAPYHHLRELEFTYGPVSQQDLADLLDVSPHLCYIDLSKCRYLPHSWMKRFDCKCEIEKLRYLIKELREEEERMKTTGRILSSV